MARTKLTLTVKPEVVRMAKRYARKHKRSVSATFSRVISALLSLEQDQDVHVPAGSALEKLSGLITLPIVTQSVSWGHIVTCHSA